MKQSLFYQYRTFFLVVFTSLCFVSCEIINPAEDIPSYIHLSGFNVSTSYGQGTAAHKITDVWVYFDDRFIGAFELPATLPLLESGKGKLLLRPGIMLNGIQSTRSVYSLYTSINLDVDLVQGEVLNIDSISDCTVYYHDQAKFPWNDRGQEDFEEGGISIDSTGNSQTRIVREFSEVFEGSASGLIELNDSIQTFEGKSIDAFILPLKGVITFVEINYKSNNSFFVGYYVNNSSGQSILRKVVEIFPKDQWNKMYINLTPYVSLETNPKNFNIWIGASKNPGVSNPRIYIDNLKIIHF